MRHDHCLLWLKINAWALIGVGGYFSWALYPPFNGLALGFLDLAVWPIDGAQNYALVETRLMAAIIGGLTVGIGAMFLMIARWVYPTDPRLGGRLILAFAVPWLIVDSMGSVISGAWFNAVINLVVFASILAPVLLRRGAPATA